MAQPVDVVTFRGIKFRRYPDAPGLAEQRYYVPGIADRQRGIKRLHEEVWIAHHRPIPAGHHVHHRDHDHLNNDPSNLDCITDDEHRAHHTAERQASGFFTTPAKLEHLERIRPLTVAWHSSPEGLAWHSENGRRAWQGREEVERVCERCGEAYRTRSAHGSEKFCSDRCRAAARRASGVDDENRTCERCTATFRVNRYSRMRFCSRSCSTRHAIAARKARGA